MVDFVPQSVRECLSLTELAVCDDPVDRTVAVAVETLKLEEGVAIGPADCAEAEDAGVSGDEFGRKRVFLLKEECDD